MGPAAAAGIAINQINSQKGNLMNFYENWRSRKHENKMYDKQHANNLELWHLQNEYNSPEAQMQRLKQAGLNPALVYGGSSGQSSGNASSAAQAPSMKSPKFGGYDFKGQGQATISGLLAHYDIEQKKAQTDLTRRQATVATQDAIYRAAQTINTGVATKKSKVELDVLREYSGDIAKQQLDKARAETDATLTDTQRKQDLHPTNLQQAAINIVKDKMNIKLTDKQIRLIITKTEIAQIEKKLNQMGLSTKDPAWIKFFTLNIERIMKKAEKNPVYKFFFN